MDTKKVTIAVVAIVAVIAIAISVFLLTKNTNTVYTISFDTNGGTQVVSQEVEEGKNVSKPTNPTKEGYEFLGWYLNGVEYDFKTPVEGDLKLEAKWKEIIIEDDTEVEEEDNKVEEEGKQEDEEKEEVTKYTVKFDSKGGSKVASKTVEKNKTVKQPADPTKDGYIFKGWFLGSVKYNFSKKVTKNITLTAKWEKVAEQKPEEEKPNTQPEEEKPNIQPEEQEKPEVKEYKVTFNTDGGSEVKAQIIKENETASKPTNPTKKSRDSKVAYIFKGWYLDGKEFDFSTKITKDRTITAKWSEIKVIEEPVKGSIINQVKIFVTLDGVKVAGTVDITYVNGTKATVSVPTTGYMEVDGTYSTITNPKAK